MLFILENIVREHHYVSDFMTAAADVANAGTCLEDGNSALKFFNVFEHLVDAVKNVCLYLSFFHYLLYSVEPCNY